MKYYLTSESQSNPANLGALLLHYYRHHGMGDLENFSCNIPPLSPEEILLAKIDLLACGILGYLNKSLRLTPHGLAVVKGLEFSKVPISFEDDYKKIIQYEKSKIANKRSWLFFQVSRANGLDIIAALLLWIVVLGGLYLAVKHNIPDDLSFPLQMVSQALLVVGTFYIAAGVLYSNPPKPPYDLAKIAENFSGAFIEASRHCIMGIIFFAAGTCLDWGLKVYEYKNPVEKSAESGAIQNPKREDSNNVKRDR